MMRKYILAALCCLFVASVQAENYPKTTENGKEYYLYKVHKSEGFYSISKRFKISREEIVRYNPETADGIKLGQVLKIPVTGDNKSLSKEEIESYNKLPEYDIEDSGRIHRVKSKETLYGISNKYEVSVDDILALNPEAVNLEAGMTLRIPKKIEKSNVVEERLESRRRQDEIERKSEEEKPAAVADNAQEQSQAPAPQEVAAQDSSKSFEEELLVTELRDIKEKHGLNELRVAIMLPFSLDSLERSRNMNHFTDFYRGCLLAADSLKGTGMHITIDAYDIGKTAMELGTVLSDSNLSKADIIIGPAYTNQIFYVADYAKSHDIRLVIPFTNKVKELESNDKIFQVLCPQKQMYDKLADKCTSEWSGKTVLIVKPDSLGITYDKRPFTDILIPKLQAAGIPCSYIPETGLQLTVDSIANSFNSLFVAGEEYSMRNEVVLVIPTSNRPKLMELSEHLSQISAQDVSIMGFPEWDNYQLKELYVKPLYIFNSYKQNPINAETQNFYKKYVDRFGRPFEQTKPSFALLGYDTFMYFAEQWKNCGQGLESHMEAAHKSQISFDFERIGNGGYLNKGFYFNLYDDEGINDL